MFPALPDAVENAYRVFAGARIGRRLNVCRCNVCFGDDTEIERLLVTTPLRAIPATILAEYTNSAHGWDDEMLHFLPRYLDLIAAGEVPCHIGVEYSLARLGSANWRADWPEREREAVERFFLALFADEVGRPGYLEAWWVPSGPPEPFYCATPLEEVFCLVANAGGDVGPLLRAFEAARGGVPSLHLAALVNDAGSSLASRRLGWHTLGGDGVPEAVIVDWLLRGATLRRVEEAFFAVTKPIDQATLSMAVTLLETATAAQG